MLYMPITLLQEGMVLACDVHCDSKLNLHKGDVLTDTDKVLIQTCGIGGVYIASDYTKDVVVNDCMGLIQRAQSLSFVRHVLSTPSYGVEFERRVNDLLQSIIDRIQSNEVILETLYSMRNYDNYTYEHSLRVTILSILIGIKMQLSRNELWEIGIAAMLHDIGKVDIDISVLNSPEKLTIEEWGAIRKHPITGCAKVRFLHGYNKNISSAILQHHEHCDGTGYPFGLHASDICTYAKIIGVADVYDALTSQRSYRDAWFPNQALEYMNNDISVQFDADVLSALLEVVVPYPEGSVVILSNGELAVVINIQNDNRSLPIVRTISGGESKVYNLAQEPIEIKSMGYTDKRLLPSVMR